MQSESLCNPEVEQEQIQHLFIVASLKKVLACGVDPYMQTRLGDVWRVCEYIQRVCAVPMVSGLDLCLGDEVPGKLKMPFEPRWVVE